MIELLVVADFVVFTESWLMKCLVFKVMVN